MERQRRTSGSSNSTGSYSRSSSGGGMPYDDRGPGPRGYSGRGNGGGRGGRPRQHDRRGGRGGGAGNGRGNHPGMMNRPPVILTRDKRQESPSMAPGAVSIMQRETSGSHIPTSTTGLPMRSVTSPALLPTPGDSGPHQPPTSLPQGRPQRRGEGLSSSPSSYTPLQPGQGGRGVNRGDTGGGSSRSTNDHSPFNNQTNEMTHSIKLLDKNWHWEDKAADYMLDQADFLVVGVIGKQGVGKSTLMSLLTGTRTGSGKPFMFKTQSKETFESGSYQTMGMDVVVTAERVILIDTQPVLSDALLDQYRENRMSVPPGMSPDKYLEVMSLQMTLFLYTICHVVVVVMDMLDPSDVIFQFLRTVEQMKTYSLKEMGPDMGVGDKQPREYFPQLVFVLNHASPDDFQPLSLREMHAELAEYFLGAKVNIAGGVSLGKSGIVPTGRAFPIHKPGPNTDYINPADVNLHLLPSNPQASDQYFVHTTSRPEKADHNLNPVFSLLPLYTGHPSFQVLAETLRNQIFAMPRPPIRRVSQQQLTERDWFDYAKRVWLTLKKASLYSEYDRILRATPPD